MYGLRESPIDMVSQSPPTSHRIKHPPTHPRKNIPLKRSPIVFFVNSLYNTRGWKICKQRQIRSTLKSTTLQDLAVTFPDVIIPTHKYIIYLYKGPLQRPACIFHLQGSSKKFGDVDRTSGWYKHRTETDKVRHTNKTRLMAGRNISLALSGCLYIKLWLT